MTKSYEPRPAGRHIRDPQSGDLTRSGDFTDPNATAAKPVAQQPRRAAVKAADETEAASPAGKGK